MLPHVPRHPSLTFSSAPCINEHTCTLLNAFVNVKRWLPVWGEHCLTSVYKFTTCHNRGCAHACGSLEVTARFLSLCDNWLLDRLLAHSVSRSPSWHTNGWSKRRKQLLHLQNYTAIQSPHTILVETNHILFLPHCVCVCVPTHMCICVGVCVCYRERERLAHFAGYKPNIHSPGVDCRRATTQGREAFDRCLEFISLGTRCLWRPQ